MPSVMISIENVIGADSVIQGFHPIPEGIRLVSTLRAAYKVILSSAESVESKVEHWLMLNGLTQSQIYESIVYRKNIWKDLSIPELRIAQLKELRGKGWGPTLVIDADAVVIAEAVRLGFTGMLYASASYFRPEFRPDWHGGPRPWAVIEEEVTRQLELKRTDPLLVEEEDVFS
jgi:hypothetical protein